MKKKSKIVFFSECFIFGGSELVLVNLLNSELMHNQFVLKYAYRYYEEYDKSVRSKILPKYHPLLDRLLLFSFSNLVYNAKIIKKRSLIKKIVTVFLRIIERSSVLSIINFVLIWKYLHREKPDIFFINNGGYPGSRVCRVAVFSAKVAGIRKILFNVNNLAFPPKSFISRGFDVFIEKYVTLFVTASYAAKNELNKSRGFDINKIINIPNTVNSCSLQLKKNILRTEFNIPEAKMIIGSAGLLTKRKGFAVMIDAIARILTTVNLDFQVYIFGEGEERISLEKKIVDLNLKEHVFLPGHKTEILNYLADFDIFVLPSIDLEDMPYIIIEAMMLQKPVIGTRVAGIPEEIEDGINGIIVEPNNIVELASALLKLLNNKELRLNYGKKSRERFLELFQYDLVISKYEKLFSKNLEQSDNIN